MRNDPVVADLVTRARNGDRRAWDALVERYAPLIWSICRRHRLDGADADDVGQSVWLQLSVPGWAYRSAASGRTAAAAWIGCAATPPSQR